MIRGRIQIHVQAVIRLYDSFTQMPVNGSQVRLILPEGAEALRKEEGCFVLLRCPSDCFTVRIMSPYYQEEELEICLPQEGGLFIKNCFLSRNQAMPMPEGTTYVEGCGEPGDAVAVFLKDKSTSMRLLEDYGKGSGRKIRIYHPPEQMLEGCPMYIQGKDGTGERFQIEKKTAEGEYLLEKELAKTYKKVGSSVYLLRETRCGADGRYSIAFRQVPREGCSCVFLDEDGIGREIPVICGERNRG